MLGSSSLYVNKCLICARFPLAWLFTCMYLLRLLIGSLCSTLVLWLARVITSIGFHCTRLNDYSRFFDDVIRARIENKNLEWNRKAKRRKKGERFLQFSDNRGMLNLLHDVNCISSNRSSGQAASKTQTCFARVWQGKNQKKNTTTTSKTRKKENKQTEASNKMLFIKHLFWAKTTIEKILYFPLFFKKWSSIGYHVHIAL